MIPIITKKEEGPDYNTRNDRAQTYDPPKERGIALPPATIHHVFTFPPPKTIFTVNK